MKPQTRLALLLLALSTASQIGCAPTVFFAELGITPKNKEGVPFGPKDLAHIPKKDVYYSWIDIDEKYAVDVWGYSVESDVQCTATSRLTPENIKFFGSVRHGSKQPEPTSLPGSEKDHYFYLVATSPGYYSPADDERLAQQFKTYVCNRIPGCKSKPDKSEPDNSKSSEPLSENAQPEVKPVGTKDKRISITMQRIVIPGR